MSDDELRDKDQIARLARATGSSVTDTEGKLTDEEIAEVREFKDTIIGSLAKIDAAIQMKPDEALELRMAKAQIMASIGKQGMAALRDLDEFDDAVEQLKAQRELDRQEAAAEEARERLKRPLSERLTRRNEDA